MRSWRGVGRAVTFSQIGTSTGVGRPKEAADRLLAAWWRVSLAVRSAAPAVRLAAARGSAACCPGNSLNQLLRRSPESRTLVVLRRHEGRAAHPEPAGIGQAPVACWWAWATSLTRGSAASSSTSCLPGAGFTLGSALSAATRSSAARRYSADLPPSLRCCGHTAALRHAVDASRSAATALSAMG